VFRYTRYLTPIGNGVLSGLTQYSQNFRHRPPKRTSRVLRIFDDFRRHSAHFICHALFFGHICNLQILCACRFCCPDFHWLSPQQIKGCGTCRYPDDDARFEQMQVERMKRNICGTSCGNQKRVIVRTDWELWRRGAGKPKPVKAYQVGKGRNWTCTYLGNWF
jgi:hypothetical protein